MKGKVIIDGHEYPVAFNLSTLIAFEQTAGHSFMEDDFGSFLSRAIIIWAAMFSADDSVKTDAVIKSGDWQGISDAYVRVMNLAADFFHVPGIVEEAERKESPSTDDAANEKNA